MKIVVNRDLCESNAVCMDVEPSVFEVDDDDELQILNEHPDESLRPRWRKPSAAAPSKPSRSKRTDCDRTVISERSPLVVMGGLDT